MDRVIFACRHNAGRSPMAAAFFDQVADPTRAKALSAGATPAERVYPERFAKHHGPLRPVVERVLRGFLECGDVAMASHALGARRVA